jgi:O-antigen biosynthesis protein
MPEMGLPMKTNDIVDKMRSECLRISCFLRTGYYSRGERVNPDVPDSNFQNHFKVYRFLRQFAIHKDVIDVGCGTGYGTAHLAEVARGIIGIDISESAIKWARKRYPGVQYLCMDAQHLQFPDRSFDLIVSTENFEHLANQRSNVKGLARILRPDGLCFVATPNPEMFTDVYNPYHTKENSFDELMDLFLGSFRKVMILENMAEPPTKAGQVMRQKRIEEGRVGIRTLANIDSTWLHNTHSFFCFCQDPKVRGE